MIVDARVGGLEASVDPINKVATYDVSDEQPQADSGFGEGSLSCRDHRHRATERMVARAACPGRATVAAAFEMPVAAKARATSVGSRAGADFSPGRTAVALAVNLRGVVRNALSSE